MANTGTPDPRDFDGPDDDELAVEIPGEALTGPPPVPVEDDDERELDTTAAGDGD
jgi:hypothetical protein